MGHPVWTGDVLSGGEEPTGVHEPARLVGRVATDWLEAPFVAPSKNSLRMGLASIASPWWPLMRLRLQPR